MAVHKIRPSKCGSRVNFTDRRLVDAVCLADKPIIAELQGGVDGALGGSPQASVVHPAILTPPPVLTSYRQLNLTK